MFKKSIVNFLLTLLTATSYLQAGWDAQSSGTSNYLSSVYFVDANTGWAVGDSGTILHTSNGGSNWGEQSSGTICWLNSVCFTDANTGWVVGDSGTILYTTNGGSNWSAQSSGTIKILYSVCFIDVNTGWAVGDSGTILHTSNGGTNWNAQPSGTNTYLSSVCFIDANMGWAVGGGGTILYTNNGGENWSGQSSGTCYQLNSVFFNDNNTGYIVGGYGYYLDFPPTKSIILHTNNGGGNWGDKSFGGPILTSVYFISSDIGWIAGYGLSKEGIRARGEIEYTIDGGSNWNIQCQTSNSEYLSSVYFTDTNSGWVVGSSGTILHTSDGGVSGLTEDNKQYAQLPEDFILSQNYPNPFNPVTQISYSLQKSSFVVLKIYDLLGKEIQTLVDKFQKAGEYIVTFDASNLASGIYFYQLQVGSEYIQTKKMLLMR